MPPPDASEVAEAMLATLSSASRFPGVWRVEREHYRGAPAIRELNIN